MTAANPVLPGANLLSTRRAIDGVFFLRPDPAVNQRVKFSLAYAARKYGVLLYAHSAPSNHMHDCFGDPEGKHPQFRQDFHSFVTRSINAKRGTKGAKWDPDPAKPCTLWDREALLDKIAYTVAQPCRHHLVGRLEDWPGFSTSIEQLAGPVEVVKRPPGFYDADGDVPEEVELRFVKPPQLADLSDDEYRQEVARRVQDYCEKAREERKAKGITVVGREKILAQDPEGKPGKTKPLGARRPTIACKTAALFLLACQWLRRFRSEHRSARQAFDLGDRTVPFPKGTFLHERRFGVTCQATGPPDFQWATA